MTGMDPSGLRAVRAVAGLTRAGPAAATGASRKTATRSANGGRFPLARLALRLARHLGKPVRALFALAPGAGVRNE